MQKMKKRLAIGIGVISIIVGVPQPTMAQGIKLINTAPDYSKYPPVGPYPTKAILFEAMATGKLAQSCFSDCPNYDWWSIVAVLQSDYDLPDVTQFISPEYVKPRGAHYWENTCLKESAPRLPDLVGRINFIMAEPEGSDRAKESGVSYHGALAQFAKVCSTDDFGKQFLSASVNFLNDYAQFYDKHVEDKKAQNAKAKEERARRMQVAAQLTQQYQACQKTPAYKVFEASKHVLEGQNQAKLGQDMLARERRLEATSGVSSLARKREAGEVIVAAQDYVSHWFDTYKKAGGTAASPSAVTVPANPCPPPNYPRP